MPLQGVASKDEPWKQELPCGVEQLAREKQAFQRARRIKSVEELLELVLLYSMADLSLREVAGVWAGRGNSISDEGVRQRLAACPQWLEGLVSKLLPVRSVAQADASPWRVVICDGSQISGPGAQGTDYRWHMAYDPGAQQVAEVHLSDVHTGESLTRYRLGPGFATVPKPRRWWRPAPRARIWWCG